MANDFELPLKGLEEREGKMYGFINEMRRWIVELRESKIKQEETNRVLQEAITEMREEHKGTRTLIDQNERMILSLVSRQDDLARSHQTQIDTQALIIRTLDRMDQKLDDLGKPGKNGHS